LTVLLLAEFYVVKFPGGEPQPFPVPPVYKYVATLPPGAVLSLPDYARTDLWFLEADYQYFSTAHWHPAVNGDAREFPPQFVDAADRMKRFPDPDAAETRARAKGVTVLTGTKEWPHGWRDVVLEDPDGYAFAVGTPL